MTTVHMLLMDALVELDEFFAARSIGWWLDSGSLIGAVRYGHLIPWDDDIDIGVTRQDFEAIMRIPDHDWPRGLTRMHRGSDPHVADCGPLKIVVNDTAVLDENWFQHPAGRGGRDGLSIDVFAFDTVPVSGARRRFVDRMRLEYYWKEMIRLGRTNDSQPMPRRHRFHLAALRTIPTPVLAGLLRVSRRVGEGSTYWGYGVNLQWAFAVEQSVIWPTVRRGLGSHVFPQPREADAYLRTLYGPDYLEEPPESERRTHALFIALPSTPSTP